MDKPTFTELWACVDCLFYTANGELPEHNESLEHDIQATLGHPSGVLSCGDSDLDEEFSSDPCEACGSHLAGSRHQLFMREEG